MRPPIEFLFPPELASDMIYSFVIIVCSLMIYIATKEIYELSSYKGLKYFRQAFLFFAVAYFFRYFIMFVLTFFNLNLWISPRVIFSLSMLVFLYSSSMAVFSLVYSVMWKKWNQDKFKTYIFNILAIAIAIIGITFRGMEVSLLLNIIFFAFASFVLFIAYRDLKGKKTGKNLLGIYSLLFIFFFLNVVDVLIPKFLQTYNIAISLVSILLFMTILYRVLKKIGN